MNKVERLFINTDSYKYSHHKQYPKGTKYVNSYIESRGSENDVIDTIIPFGLQAYIVEYISDFKLNALNLPYDHFQNLYNQIESHMNSSYDEFNTSY
jgi:nicotinic acid phosphoribosyltransferase